MRKKNKKHHSTVKKMNLDKSKHDGFVSMMNNISIFIILILYFQLFNKEMKSVEYVCSYSFPSRSTTYVCEDVKV